MTGNLSLLTDVKPINGGYVAFAGDKGGQITGEGTVSNGKISFEKVNYCKQLQHNLLSVSQVCDKKYTTVFNDVECMILKPGFVIPEEWILMRAPRRKDTYVLDMRNMSSTADFTCLLTKASERDSLLWHRRMGHIHFRKMNFLVKNNLVEGVPNQTFLMTDHCLPCKKGKQHKKSHLQKIVNSIQTPLELLHMDLFGPVNVKSIGGKSYCLVVTDDFSRFSWVYFLHSKDETPEILKFLFLKLENLCRLKIKMIRSDNGTEFKNHNLELFCLQHGIHHQFSAPRTPQQNGVAERKNRTLIEAARTMLSDSKLPITFWAEAVNTACYVLNRVLTVKKHNKTCYELLNNRKPNLKFLEPFGCPCTLMNTKDRLSKFGEKSSDGFFLGYSVNSPNKRVFNKATGKIEECYEVECLRYSSPQNGIGPNWLFDYDTLFNSFNILPDGVDDGLGMLYGGDDDYVSHVISSTSAPTQSNDDPVSQDISSTAPTPSPTSSLVSPSDNVEADENENNDASNIGDNDCRMDQNLSNLDSTIVVEENPTLRIHSDHPTENILGDLSEGVRTRHQLQQTTEGLAAQLESCFLSQIEPKNVKMALQDSSWVEAMQEELQQFVKLQVWQLVKLPKGVHPIGTRWVFWVKKDDRGVVVRNKARLVVQGFTQIEGLDYDEVFAPVARLESIRLFLAYASFKRFKVYQLDVKSAFLYEKVHEEVYVCQPPGFEDSVFPDYVYKLDKALYGLHQAPRAWYETLSQHLLQNGFTRGQVDSTLFIKKSKDDLLLVQIYVDDIIFGSTNEDLCKDFEKIMKSKFEMSSMGEMTFFLGLQVKQSEKGIFIHQSKYVNDILTRFKMIDCKVAGTPIEVNHKLAPDLDMEDADQREYRSMIGSLMYLTASRPDIMFAVSICSRYQAHPKISHLKAVKRIFCYLKGKPTLGLWYPTDDNFLLTAFSDSDYGGCNMNWKSTTGGCQFLGNRLVSWQCKKQMTVSTSTAEAKYNAASSCCSQVLWIQHQMRDYGLFLTQTPIHIDNTAAICIIRNPVQHSKTKHIEIRYHFIRDCYEKKLIDLIRIDTSKQNADIFTKAFPKNRFEDLVSMIGMQTLDQ